MGRLNLSTIELSLRSVQENFDSINLKLIGQRDPMSNKVVENLLSGYLYIDFLVDRGIDVFSKGQHGYLLELNSIVLCGSNKDLRVEFSQHIEATRRKFYEEPDGGIEDIAEWYASHLRESIWQLAAGIYVRTLTRPQLFIEGNHRTGILMASYLLLQGGKPPFVLTTENASSYFDPSAVIRNTEKFGLLALYRFPSIKKKFSKFLESHSNFIYLL